MAFDLTGRTALVTGSSRSIGKAIALALARAGAGVALHGRTQSEQLAAAEREVAALGVKTVSLVADLSARSAPAELVAQAARELGRLDILVNNAGIVTPTTAEDMDAETWEAVLRVNLTSAFFLAQAAAREMRRGGFGRIINLSSAAAEASIPGYVHYGVSKAGLNAMTKYLAVEWAGWGITVNTVAPAFVRTDMAEQVFKQMPALYEDQLGRVAKHRMGEVDEVAAAVLYLASAEADYTTGEVLHVDGGYLTM